MHPLLLTLALFAPSPQDDGTAAVEALKQEQSAAQEVFFEKYSAAETDEAKQKLFETSYPEPEQYAPRFLAIASTHPGTDAAREALLWVAQNVRDGEDQGRALDGLLRQFKESEGLASVCSSLRYDTSARGEQFLRTLFAESPHAKVRGTAAYNLAHALRQSAELAARLEEAEGEEATNLNEWLGEANAARLAALDPAAVAVETRELLDLVVAEYGDVEAGRETLGESATGDIFELENLAIGQVAPEIEGEDIDGVAFKLSDYRGRVVVLDFWGDW